MKKLIIMIILINVAFAGEIQQYKGRKLLNKKCEKSFGDSLWVENISCSDSIEIQHNLGATEDSYSVSVDKTHYTTFSTNDRNEILDQKVDSLLSN